MILNTEPTLLKFYNYLLYIANLNMLFFLHKALSQIHKDCNEVSFIDLISYMGNSLGWWVNIKYLTTSPTRSERSEF